MKDRLKESVDDRRADYEVYEADFDQLWDNIDDKLNKSRFSMWSVAGKIAAAILVLVVAGFGYFALNDDNTRDGYALHDISPELAETEYFYSQQVAEKLHIIKSSNANVDKEVMNNLLALDSAYQELKKDLKDNADNEEVISAMITNYRLKLTILEQILKEIKQHDQNEEHSQINI